MWQVRIFSVCIVICLLCLVSISAQEINLGVNPLWQKGNPNAKYKIEVFNDYSSPTGASFNKKPKQIENRHTGKILIIFRNHPLYNMRKNAMFAAQAVEAAGKQGKFWEMMEIIYRDQNKWNYKESVEKIFIKYARKVGINKEKFKQDFQSQEILERIKLDIERGKSLKVDSIPTVFLNDEKLSFLDAENLEEIISNKR
jgi:protein-disulfide isomerase